jgi:hypothetical protein
MARLLLSLALALAVLEGAIRKWVIGSEAGSWSYLAYFSKDILFASLLLMPRQAGTRPALELFRRSLVIGGGLVGMGGAIAGCRDLNSVGAALTFRATLALPIIACGAVARLSGLRLLWFAVLIGMLTCLNCGLGVAQNRLPVDHVLNRYVASQTEVAALESGVRATGTFSYISGLALLSSIGIWAGIVILSCGDAALWKAAGTVTILAGTGCGLASVSRGPLIMGGLLLASWVCFARSGAPSSVVKSCFGTMNPTKAPSPRPSPVGRGRKSCSLVASVRLGRASWVGQPCIGTMDCQGMPSRLKPGLQTSGSRRAAFSKTAWVLVLIVVAGLALGLGTGAKQMASAVLERHQQSGESFQERVFGQLGQVAAAASIAPLGQGLGTEQVAGNYATTGTMKFTTFEDQLPRLLLETGVLGVVGFIIICGGAILSLQVAKLGSKDPCLRAVLLVTQFLLGCLFYTNVVFNHTASALAWMIFAAVMAAATPAGLPLACAPNSRFRNRFRRAHFAL